LTWAIVSLFIILLQTGGTSVNPATVNCDLNHSHGSRAPWNPLRYGHPASYLRDLTRESMGGLCF